MKAIFSEKEMKRMKNKPQFFRLQFISAKQNIPSDYVQNDLLFIITEHLFTFLSSSNPMEYRKIY